MRAAGDANANAKANAALIHKLMSDPNFRLEHKKPSPIEQHIKAVIKKGFWDNFSADVSAGKFERVLVLIGEIRDRLLSLVPSRKDMQQEIIASLDTKLLKQILVNGAFDISSLTNIVEYIISKIKQLQSPGRDEETTKWVEDNIPALRNSTDQGFVQKLPVVLEFLFEKLDQIELDLANYKLQQLKPFLDNEGALYQRKKFAAQVQSGQVRGKSREGRGERGEDNWFFLIQPSTSTYCNMVAMTYV